MKVLIGMTRSDTIVSGSFKHICQIGEKFRDEGAEVVYALGGNGDAITKLRAAGFKVHALTNLKRDLSPLSDIWSLLKLIWLIISENPQVCSWHTAKIGALGRIAAMLTFKRSYYVPHGVPFVNTPENKGFKKYERLEKLLSYLPSKIIGVCEFDKNEYLRIGVPDKKLLVIRNGMLGKFNDTWELTDKPVNFITAARFEDQKDYTTLAQACSSLLSQSKPFTLSIYGDGQYEAKVKQLFAHFPEGVINFCGVVDNFAEKLTQADVFILSSFWEGLPRSIIEAMACKKAVIASDVGGCSELIIKGESGYLIPIRDASTMAIAMSEYINNKTKTVSHGDAAYTLYKQKYSLPVMLESYAKEYGVIKSGVTN
ncbi:glycosyltransferase family 4 protein [Pseudoalteromonas distincta]|jgi:glycosyltransferase involved in cell wall biosynthesis|uniref:glycosyltransferase family 4 protein n=1 Tax=Pseudoalteromonas distincta TaxID=77608 RepID=UPI001190E89A|nr:glycosyltransferase family 4 protein [Pseudoalteromonas elyakovii]TVU77503.1 glycosyltransferase family 4 protein [Pseudoalteromonas elyakovii]|tara:strand:+ start:2194 stop:3303 length:1110 start_codon:yes stop_codon:yes gene_type:complete